MKKTAKFILLIALLLVVGMLLAACGGKNKDEHSPSGGDNNDGQVELARPSEGLEYKVNKDGTTCTITGIGTCADTDIVIGDEIDGYTVTIIGSSAFKNCTAIKSVKLPESVTAIYNYAFAGCTSLEKVNIPAAVSIINMNMFQGCASLFKPENNVYYVDTWVVSCENDATSITVREGTVGIAYNAFYGKQSLNTIKLPNSIKYINEGAFGECTGLTDLSIPEGITYIEANTFFGCSNLKNLSLPSSISEVYTNYTPFSDCENLVYNVYQGGKYLGNAQNPYLIFAGVADETVTALTLHENTKIILFEALAGNESIKSVTMGNNISQICVAAFKNCAALESVVLPDSLTIINSNMFEGCSALTNVNFPKNLKKIDFHAFYQCKQLSNLTLPQGIEDIEQEAFAGCRMAETISIPNSVCYLGSQAFDYSYYPLTEYNGGKYLGNESNPYLVLVTVDKEVTSFTFSPETKFIGDAAFRKCTALTNITLPENIIGLDNNTFYGCTSLENVVILGNVKRIGQFMFGECTGLKSVTLPTSIESIVIGAFRPVGSTLTIVYNGTKEQWNHISKQNLVFAVSGTVYTIRCTDGDIVYGK